MKKLLILGGAGTGKTTRVLEIVRAALRRGVHPSRIALVSFTNAATDEARDRAMKEFKLIEKDLPYFRTTHSFAFRELGLNPDDVLGESHLQELSEITGELFTGDSGVEGPAAGRNADPLLTLDHYARTTRRGLRLAWEDHGGDVDWFRLKRFSTAYALFKEQRDLVDFTDMLEKYVTSAATPAPVEIAIVDEVQDLTLLQHAVVEKAFAGVAELYFAGDDWQSVHKWAGAAEDYLLELDWPREIVPLAHRLPRQVFGFAQGIVDRLERKFDKPSRPADREGSVEWLARADEADLSSGKWLLLARTRSMLIDLAAEARRQGVVYSVKGASSVNAVHVTAIQAHERLRSGGEVFGGEAATVLKYAGVKRPLDEDRSYTAKDLNYDASPIWHDALTEMALDDREYYLTCLRRGEKLTAPPRVRVETIHGAKGLEAENVVLLTDLSYRTQRAYELDPDSEHRVWYVGATRASNRLFPVEPSGPYRYPL